jgi:hypothetical protein
MPTAHFSISQSLWIRGDEICQTQRNAISETQALRERGAQVFLLKGTGDQDGLAKLKQILWRTDVHVVLSWLHPKELNVLRPLLEQRRNFSILTDDWHIHPPWLMREAEYLLFRKYNGLAVRLGDAPFMTGGEPPLLLDPRPDFTQYPITCAALRPFVLAATPIVEAWQKKQQRERPIDPARLLYFPFAIDPNNVPVGTVPTRYDFANTGGVLGIWIMRDPYAPFRYSFANLYHDRRLLTAAIARLENNPFTFYDCMRERGRLPYAEYILKNHQSRYLIASGGLHDATVPKFTEYACVGTPMIGRGLPYEYPWLDDCLIPVDMMHPTPEYLKPLLQQALDRYPQMRQNCLNWRDRLLKLYDLQNLLDLVQEQADGKPIRPGYLKKDLKHPAAATAGQPER